MIRTAPSQVDIQEDIKASGVVLEKMQLIFAREEDVHRHTGYLGEQYREVFVTLDQKYQLSTTTKTVETVIEEIQSQSNGAEVRATLDSIRSAGNTIEPETGINVQELLVRTWSLTDHVHAPSNAKRL